MTFTHEYFNNISVNSIRLHHIESLLDTFPPHQLKCILQKACSFYIAHANKLRKAKYLHPQSKYKSRGKSTNHRGAEDATYSNYIALIRNLTEVLEYCKFLLKGEN